MLFYTVTDDVLHNVALKKLSYQVSEDGEHSASLANDGLMKTCARSQSETNPWWAVDLGAETLVAQVNLINGGDDIGIQFTITVCSSNYMYT